MVIYTYLYKSMYAVFIQTMRFYSKITNSAKPEESGIIFRLSFRFQYMNILTISVSAVVCGVLFLVYFTIYIS